MMNRLLGNPLRKLDIKINRGLVIYNRPLSLISIIETPPTGEEKSFGRVI